MAVGGLALIKAPRLLRAMDAPRSLALHHLHTDERLAVQYYAAGEYVPQALHEVNHLLRDWRRNEIHPIEPELLDLLNELHRATGSKEPFEVICGYRSPQTNAMLRQHSKGVASNSLHLVGKAIDIRLSDVPLSRLRDVAKSQKRGGVGYYRASNFVHVDTGRVRYW
ncbi:MAG: YcbK family protein [Gemmatimonadales bacterium]